MTPAQLLKWLPHVLVVLLAVAMGAVVRRVARRAPAPRRAVLIAMAVLGALPALYVGLTWAELIPGAYLRLARPWATLVGLAATTFIVLRLADVSLRQGPWRARLGDLLAPLAAFIAGFAAAGPEVGRPLDRLTVIVAIDRSRSIDLVPQADKRIEHNLTVLEVGMRDDDRVGTVAFAAEAATEDPPRPKSSLPAPQRVVIGRDGTDIASAIRRGLAEVPPDSAARIVIVSDGVATRGDTMSAAAAAVAAEVPVDVVPLEQRLVPDVRLVALRAPTRADEGETMELRLVTSAPAPTEIELRLKRDGELISKARAKIDGGEDILRIREKAPGPGLHRYDVEITAIDAALDQAPEDNSGSAFVRVRGQASALVIDGDAGKTRFVASALRDAAFLVEEGAGTSLPPDLAGLARFDVLVFGDVAASELTPGQLEAIGSYVRDLGGGLVLMGGDRSMGPGGYARTAVEEVSPVSFDLKQEKRRASLAEVIGIDISGSMAAVVSGHTKLELANEGAARSAALLGPGDLLGVEHVDTAVQWSVPLGPINDAKAIEKAIRAVGPGGGGIDVDITLEAAYKALDKVQVNLKHVLLFADGADADKLGPPVRAMVDAAYRRQITTSFVALGRGKDIAELEHLSRMGGGRFYLIEDATRLPAVFTQETILASRSALVEKDFRVASGVPSPATSGVKIADAPILKGYVVTIPKSRATVLLTGPESDPILATWSAGVGRSAAFTSDLKDRWGIAWTQWPGAARLIAQTARDVSRKGDDPRVRLEADASGGELSIRATVVGDDGRAHSFRRLVTVVAGPDGFRREVPLEATGAGAYGATVPLSRPGTYIAVARDELSGEAVGTAGAALTAGEELRPTGSDLALLGRIVELTRGKKRESLAGVFADRATLRFAYEDVTRALLLAGALLLLFMVAARRLALPEAWTAWLSRARTRPAQPALASATAGGPQAQATMQTLLSAKERARQEQPVAKPAARIPSAAAAPVGARPIASPHTSGPPSVRPAGVASSHEASGPPSARPLTAAEILLARRKGKRL